jgi:polyisoprenoid-binding protein YceI
MLHRHKPDQSSGIIILKSDDFFNAEKYPALTFVGESFTHVGDDHLDFTG